MAQSVIIKINATSQQLINFYFFLILVGGEQKKTENSACYYQGVLGKKCKTVILAEWLFYRTNIWQSYTFSHLMKKNNPKQMVKLETKRN